MESTGREVEGPGEERRRELALPKGDLRRGRKALPLSESSLRKGLKKWKETWPEGACLPCSSLVRVSLEGDKASLLSSKSSCFLSSALSSDFFLFLEKVPPEYRETLSRSGRRKKVKKVTFSAEIIAFYASEGGRSKPLLK